MNCSPEMSSGKCTIRLILILFLFGILLELVLLTGRTSIRLGEEEVESFKSLRDVDVDNDSLLEEPFPWTADKNVLNEPIQYKKDKSVPYLKVKNPNEQFFRVEENFTASTEYEWKMPYWNMTLEQREEFQQEQVAQYCKHHGFKSRGTRGSLSLGRHILRNDKMKTAFCFAPKVGCTNLKILFFLSQGAVPSSMLFKERDHVNNELLEEAINTHSFIGLSTIRKQRILKTYYKFVMYRNPVDRLLSAYRSKIERKPLYGLERDIPHYNWLKKEIFEYKHPDEFEKWKAGGGIEEVSIGFPDFIDYWLSKGSLRYDEHFQSIYNLCQPCYVRYNYYGNFDNFEKDAEVLASHVDSDTILLRDSYYEDGEETSSIAPQYYDQLDDKQKKLVITRLSQDLSFYYTIFPSERDRHKNIMNIDFDVPMFSYH